MKPLVEGGKAPPSPSSVARVKFPRASRRTLGNGLRVVLLPHRQLPWLVTLASVSAGDRDDPPDKVGRAGLTARLLREGTATRRGADIAQTVDCSGGSLEAGSHMDRTSLHIDVLSMHQDLALTLVRDLLSCPVFPEEEVAQMKARVSEELLAMRTNPELLAEELSALVSYGTHPYGRYAPTPASLGALGRKDLLAFHMASYLPASTTLLLVGDFDAGQTMKEVESHFGSWESGAAPRARLARPPEGSRSRDVHVLDRADSVQSHLRVVMPAVNRSHADFVALEVLNKILGGGTTSRLFQNLRQKHGFTYSIRSDIEQRNLASQLAIEGSVRTEVTAAALREILSELDALGKGVDARELEEIKEEMIGQFPLSLESPHALAYRLLSIEHFGLSEGYWEGYRDALAAVTVADLTRVARRYATSSRCRIIVVGQSGAVIEELASLGPVRSYAVSGSMSIVSPHLGQSQ